MSEPYGQGERWRDRHSALMGADARELPSTETFNQITRLAAFCFNASVAVIAVADGEQIEFVSAEGLKQVELFAFESLCEETVRRAEFMTIEDLPVPKPITGTVPADDAENVLGAPHIPSEPKAQADANAAAEATADAPADAPGARSFAGVPLIDDAGRSVGVLAVGDAIPRVFGAMERRQLEALGRLAMNEITLRRSMGRRDPETGLPNERQLLSDLKAAALAYCGDYRLLTVVDIFDVVSAQAVMQSLGRGPIEALVQHMSERLQTRLQGVAQVYRVAETRFAFMLDSTATMDHAPFMEALFLFAGRTVSASGVPIRPSLRAGMVNVRLRDAGMFDALSNAIAAVDESIQTNRAWTLYDIESNEQVQRSYDLATGLQRALANDEFYLVYQPRVELHNGRVTAVEALVRWRHSILGTLFPSEFIPIAERTAVMQALTAWVAHTGLAQLARWSQCFPTLELSINLSAIDFESGELCETLVQACRRHLIAPQRLQVEVRDGQWMREASVLSQLEAIRRAGVQVAIDDFGAAYTNASYLSQLPVDIIKLDASLIHDLSNNEHHQTIVKAIVELAHKLGYRTVAEGVELASTLAILTGWGCDELQGYLIGRPAGPDAVQDFITRAGSRVPMPRAEQGR